jgi:hypothetical protein
MEEVKNSAHSMYVCMYVSFMWFEQLYSVPSDIFFFLHVIEKPVQVHPADPVITFLILGVTKDYFYCITICSKYYDLLKSFSSDLYARNGIVS